jgi:siroheme synthase-like protein
MAHKFMPISVSLKERSCLVVGGGPAALRRVESLLDYETAITVVAPEIEEKLEYHAEKERITLERRDYRSPEAAGYGLVICATDDAELSRQVREDARGAGVLVNVVGDLPNSDFILPAVLRRDCLTAAISTDGKAPFISGHLRLVLENAFPKHWERLVKLAASFQKRVRSRWGDDRAKRNACFSEFLEADWKTMLKELSDDQVEEELARMLEIPA